MNYFFTSDEHYGHYNIIKHCNRPFKTVKEMDDEIIRRHNEIVTDKDFVIHAGDFCWHSKFEIAQKYMVRLNGKHIFLRGSHDKWAKHTSQDSCAGITFKINLQDIYEKEINSQYVVVSHYAMRTWSRSHYGSWNLHGHSHGRLQPLANQLDIGVDNNNFYPFSFEDVKERIFKKEKDAKTDSELIFSQLSLAKASGPRAGEES